MSSRYLIPVLCVGAVVFACGPRAHNEGSTPQQKAVIAQSSGLSVVSQQGAARVREKEVKSPVSAQLFVRRIDSDIRFTMYVTNTSKKRVELKFANGQTYDFVVLDSVGREMWRWGSARMFTQALRNTLLRSGEMLEFDETLRESPLPPGRYVARATLTSTNFPLVQEAEFVVSETTLASR